MQSLEVSGAVRPIYGSLGVKRLITKIMISHLHHTKGAALTPTLVAKFRCSAASLSALLYRISPRSVKNMEGKDTELATHLNKCGLLWMPCTELKLFRKFIGKLC